MIFPQQWKDPLPFSWYKWSDLPFHHWQLCCIVNAMIFSYLLPSRSSFSYTLNCHIHLSITITQISASTSLAFVVVCVSFSSLFIQCMWMLNKSLWIFSIYSLLEHYHPLWNLSGRTAWLHHFQSGIVSICCLPGFIIIVFLFSWGFTASCKSKTSFHHSNYFGLFQKLGLLTYRKF